jgi:ketosteroid isomerase-like protein
MRKMWWTVVVLAALSVPGLAQEAGLKADNPSLSKAAVEKLELDIAKMLIAGNWDEYGSHLADEFVRTASHGELENKQQAWAEFRSGHNKLLDMIPEELQVVTYGDAAVVTSHVSILSRQNGKVITTFSRFTDTFVQRDGRWYMIASQATPVAK